MGLSKCNIIILVGFFICLHHVFFSKYKHTKFLSTMFLDKYGFRITGWSLSHFVWFYIIGKFCPDHLLMFMLVGVSWEVFEYMYGAFMNDTLYWTSFGIKGQLMDIFMNFSGYYLASIF